MGCNSILDLGLSIPLARAADAGKLSLLHRGIAMEPSLEEKSLEKWVPALDSPSALNDALEKAVDYRGDITVTLKDGARYTGYAFNHNRNAPEPYLELLPPDKDEKIRVPVKDIAGFEFFPVSIQPRGVRGPRGWHGINSNCNSNRRWTQMNADETAIANCGLRIAD